MRNIGIVEIPERVHGFIKEQVLRTGGPLEGVFKAVELAEECPSPVDAASRRAFFPGVVVVYETWDRLGDDGGGARDDLPAVHTMTLGVFKLLARGEKPGPGLRAVVQPLANLFSQERFDRPPRDPIAPTDLSLALWRPADYSSTGITIEEVFIDRIRFFNPVAVDQKTLVERADLTIKARAISRA